MIYRFERLPSRDIFNACDPAWLYPICVQHKEDWWLPEFASRRALLREWYVELFEAKTQHYSRLRASIWVNGIMDPIVITKGKPLRREPWMLPPGVRDGGLICEQLGGSRLMIAQEFDLDIPCIINDQDGEGGEQPNTLLDHFQAPEDWTLKLESTGVRIVPKRYSHMPEDYDLKRQQRARREVWAEMVERYARL